MPGDFLPMLRQTNVLPRNRGSDRPFGMPDIDSGNVAAMFRQTIPLSESIKNQDMQRRKQMMQFEQSLANQPSRGRGVQNFGGTSGAGMVAQPGAGAGGFSPMQRRFQEQDDLQKRQRFQDEQAKQEIGGKYKQAIDERELMEEGAYTRNRENIEGRYNVAGLEGDMRSQLENDKARYAAIQDKVKHGYKLTEDEAKSYHDTRGRILENEAKPPTPRDPKEGQDAIITQLQRLRIQYPEIAKAITQVEGEPMQIDWKRLNPQQTQFVQEYLTGQAGATIDPNTGVPARTDSRRKGARPLPPRQAPLAPGARPPVPQETYGKPPLGRMGVPPSGRSR